MTAAGGVLAMSVTLRDERGVLFTCLAGSTPPAWAAARIKMPRAWASAPAQESAPTPEPVVPEPVVAEPVEEVPAPPVEEAPAPESTPDAPEAVEDLIGELPEPPKRGAGSGRDAWVAYAASKGVTVTADTSRDEIIAMFEG